MRFYTRELKELWKRSNGIKQRYGRNYMHKVNADGVVQAYAKSTYGVVGTFTNLKMKCYRAGMPMEKEEQFTSEAIG